MAIILNKLQKPYSDYLGIISSILCLVHCLITPAILSFHYIFMKTTSQFEMVEYIFLIMSFLAVFFSAKNYNGYFGKITMWFMFSVFAVSIIFHSHIPVFISYIASSGLVLLHIFNLVIKNKVKLNSLKNTK